MNQITAFKFKLPLFDIKLFALTSPATVNVVSAKHILEVALELTLNLNSCVGKSYNNLPLKFELGTVKSICD